MGMSRCADRQSTDTGMLQCRTATETRLPESSGHTCGEDKAGRSCAVSS